MCEETVLNFERVDVLPASDDKVFNAPSDFDVPKFIDGCFVARLYRTSYQQTPSIHTNRKRQVLTNIHSLPLSSTCRTSFVRPSSPQYPFITKSPLPANPPLPPPPSPLPLSPGSTTFAATCGSSLPT